MAGVVDVIGLGRGEEHFFDPRREQAGEPGIATDREGRERLAERRLEIGKRCRAGIERRQRVDEHDLPVEPGEMLAEERHHHDPLIGLEALRHQPGERARHRLDTGRKIERCEGQRRRAVEIARHQEAPGRRHRDGLGVGP